MKTVFFIGYVPTSSMEPTLKKDSIIFGTRLFDDLQTGDIIVFTKDGTVMVKRIAAIAGETITIEGITYMVPENSYFVLGGSLTACRILAPQPGIEFRSSAVKAQTLNPWPWGININSFTFNINAM